MEYNIYCDESCHLEHDGINVMVLGAIWLPKECITQANQDIRDIKIKYGISPYAEMKWVRISPAKKDLFLDLVHYFFEQDDLHFRALVVPDKSILDHSKFNQTHDEWYYKMYFDMLKKLFRPGHQYYIYPDIKDSHSYYRAKTLQSYLCNEIRDFNHDCVRRIQPINSNEVQIMQIVDIFTGAVAYKNRLFPDDHICSETKLNIVDSIARMSKTKLTETSPYRNNKFNIVVWDPSKKKGNK